MKGSYYIFLEPYVYVSFTINEVLLFNTLDGNLLRYSDPDIIQCAKDLCDPVNEGVAIIDLSDNDLMKAFVSDLRNLFMGDVVLIHELECKPIQLMAYPRVDIEINNQVVKNVLNALMEITFFLDNECDKNCRYCKSYFKQFDSCHCYKSNKEHECLNLVRFFDFISPVLSDLLSVNIVLSNTMSDNDIKYLMSLSDSVKSKINLIVNYKNITILPLCIIHEFKSRIKVLITDFKSIDFDCISLYNFLSYNWVVENENNIKFLIENNLLASYDITLFYNGDNFEFVNKQASFTIKDIQLDVRNMQIIHQNIFLNSSFYGKLYVYNDGSIRSHPMGKVIGNALKDTLLDIVCICVNDKKSSWFFTRNKRKVCSDCLFKYLCPPISNLEWI